VTLDPLPTNEKISGPSACAPSTKLDLIGRGLIARSLLSSKTALAKAWVPSAPYREGIDRFRRPGGVSGIPSAPGMRQSVNRSGELEISMTVVNIDRGVANRVG
jgi:hypothetical protein